MIYPHRFKPRIVTQRGFGRLTNVVHNSSLCRVRFKSRWSHYYVLQPALGQPANHWPCDVYFRYNNVMYRLSHVVIFLEPVHHQANYYKYRFFNIATPLLLNTIPVRNRVNGLNTIDIHEVRIKTQNRNVYLDRAPGFDSSNFRPLVRAVC